MVLLLTGCGSRPRKQPEEAKAPPSYQGIVTHGSITVRLLEVTQQRVFITIKEHGSSMRPVLLPGVTLRLLVEQQGGPPVPKFNLSKPKFYTREGKPLEEGVAVGFMNHSMGVHKAVFEPPDKRPPFPWDPSDSQGDPSRSHIETYWFPGLVLPAEAFHLRFQVSAGEDPMMDFDFRDIPQLPPPR